MATQTPQPLGNAQEQMTKAALKEPDVHPAKKDSPTLTRWTNFARAKVRPKRVTVVGYKPKHLFDRGSHTTIQPTAQAILGNIAQGGGFEIELGYTKEPWMGWQELADAGVEITDFRSANNAKELEISPVVIQEHMKSHLDQNRRMRSGGTFWITLSTAKPQTTDEFFADEV